MTTDRFATLYRQIASDTASMPNKEAWAEITARLKATNHTWGLCAARDFVWSLRSEYRRQQAA